eukprot:TRINITY_DN64859_c0_g1_i1.p1 TRINITY_DN64859_c0_g1~~TRINITY_DN64859_c0_g1_i1.p1  ORF type:complete len:1150 (+),score=235.68 TRINITY_DN64859_c0_g1_i1:159-3452(+)
MDGTLDRMTTRKHAKGASGDTTQLKVSAAGGWDLEDAQGNKKSLSSDVVEWFKRRNGETLEGSVAFVPWIVQQAYFEGMVKDDNIVLHRGTGALVFSDASGFTALTERLAAKAEGAELLSQCLTSFFTPLIELINAYRGDVIKFSGDALTVYFPAVDDAAGDQTKFKVPPHGSFGLPDIGPMATSVLRACGCCIEIQKRLHMFDTGVDGVKLCLHIGVGCGEVAILQVGGLEPPETHVPRSEYIIAGPPLSQVAIAEPLAKNGETCVSPEAWEHIKGCVVEDTSRPLDEPGFHLLLKLNESMYTFPTIKASARERDRRKDNSFSISELDVIRKFIPSAVFKQIEGGTLTYVNEMRNISTVFICCSGCDVSTDEGSKVAQELMVTAQRVCYANEGTLNKFLIDDKGILFLLAYGLPPLVHTDDASRAVLASLELVKAFQQLNLVARIGVSTGRAYCGVCGSRERMEYTVLGDAVNLAARLMANAEANGVLIDEETSIRSSIELNTEALAPIKVKGKVNEVKIFKPSVAPPNEHIGVGPGGLIHFPWYDRPATMQGKSITREMIQDSLQTNVRKLCGLHEWRGMNKIQALLGGEYDPELHQKPACMPEYPGKKTPPSSSPFSQGGSLVIQGPTGVGKVELTQHAVVHAATHFNMVPIFGSMGPRVQDPERMGVELVRSCLGAFRHLDNALPADDLEALRQLLPANLHEEYLGALEEALAGLREEKRVPTLSKLVDAALVLIDSLRKKVSIIMVVQLEYGTSLFGSTFQYFDCFWETLSKLMNTVSKGGPHPIVLLTLCKNPDHDHPAVKAASSSGWLIELVGLTQEACKAYISSHLQVKLSSTPERLLTYVAKLSIGNPLYIRETLAQLLKEGHIQLSDGAGSERPEKAKSEGEAIGEPEDADEDIGGVRLINDLDSVNIAAWSHTAMVGETLCLLESLDPLESAVLKMATVFSGHFALPDLASSSCSRWSGANRFDYLRLFRAVQELEERGILERCKTREMDKSKSATSEKHIGIFKSDKDKAEKDAPREQQLFEMKNQLIRKVGGSMLLEAQKKKVKRQALIERALQRDLPARMEELQQKKLEPHIPWYYENILTRA